MAEGIENRPTFREAFQRRRYLVPVDNFYEWKRRYRQATLCASRRRVEPLGRWPAAKETYASWTSPLRQLRPVWP